MGFGDFVSGAMHAGGNLVSDAVGATENAAKVGGFVAEHAVKGAGWVATHPAQTIEGIGKGVEGGVKAGVWTAEHAGEMAAGTVKGVSFLASHPQYWDDAAKMIVKDQLKPQNLAITAGLIGLTVATGGIAGIGLGTKIAETVGEVGTVGRVVEGAAEGVQVAEKVGRGARFMNAVRGSK